MLSEKGERLLALYRDMFENGYYRGDGSFINKAFADFELRVARYFLAPIFQDYAIRTVLDYGAGQSDWNAPAFDDTGKSAVEFFNLKWAAKFEPGLYVDERKRADAVVCFDVLEHVFISDIPAVVRDLFSMAGTLVVANVATYPAAARLPNGENAHVTQRPGDWWKGVFDMVSLEFPKTAVLLMVSDAWQKFEAFVPWKADGWQSGGFQVHY